MRKVALIAGGVLVFIAVVTLALLRFYKNDIRDYTEREISRGVNGQLTFSDFHVSIFKDFPNVTVTLDKIAFVGAGEFAHDTLATVQEFHIDLRTTSLFGSQVEVKSMRAVRPEIFLEILPDGHANYLEIAKVDTVVKPIGTRGSGHVLRLDYIAIEDGALRYVDEANVIKLACKGVSYIGRGDFSDTTFDLASKVTMSSVNFDMGKTRYLSDKRVMIEAITELNIPEQKITFKDNTVQINHFKFGFDGTIGVRHDALDLNVQFLTQETSFRNILSLIPGIYMEDFDQIETSGEMEMRGFIKGLYATDTIPTFATEVKVRNAMFKIDSLPAPVENIQLDLIVSNEYADADSLTLDLKQFQFDMLKRSVKGRLRLEGYPDYTIDADIFADLDLALLEKMYPIRGFDMKGELQGEIKAKGKYSLALSHDSLQHHTLKSLPVFSAKLKVTDGGLKFDSLPNQVTNVQFHFDASNASGDPEETRISIHELRADMDDNSINGFFHVKGYQRYVLDTDLKATVDLAVLEKYFPITGVDLRGMVNADIVAKGTWDSDRKKFPVVDASVSIRDGYLKTADMPEPMKNVQVDGEVLNATGRFKDTDIRINKLTYLMEDEPFIVQGHVQDLDNYYYDLKIKGLVDLAKISRIYPIDRFSICGIVNSDLEAKGSLTDIENKNFAKLLAVGAISLTNVKVESTQLKAPLQISSASFKISPELITMDTLRGHIGKTHFSLSGDLSHYMAFVTRNNDIITGDLFLKCDTVDLNDWFATTGPSAPATTTTVQSTKSGVSKTSSPWLVPRNVNFTFDSEIGELKYQDMLISALDGEIKVNNGVLSLHETGFNSLNAKFSLTGDYNTVDVNHPLFDFALDIKELDINKAYREIKLVRDFAPAAEHTYGKLSLDYKLKGELTSTMMPKTETVVGGGEVQIADAKINGMKIFEEISKTAKKKDFNDPHLKDVIIKSEIKNSKLFVKPFSIKLSGLNTDIEGVSNVDGTIQYLVQIELLPVDKLKIPFHVTGSYADPKVAIGKGHKLPQE